MVFNQEFSDDNIAWSKCYKFTFELHLNNIKLETTSTFFKILHGLSVAIFASTSFISLYYLIEKFVSV